MDVDRLRLFREAAERGSIAAAARASDLDPSAVSRSIAALERELGVRLLQRTTRRLALTEAGAIYLERVSPMLDGLAAARAAALDVVEEPRGLLRVTASNGFGQTVIVPIVPAFAARHPEVKLDLVLTDMVLDLVAENIDLAFRLGPRPSSDLISGMLAPAPRHLVASPDYLRRNFQPAHPRELPRLACLLTSTDRKNATWLFRRGDEEHPVAIQGQIASSNTLALRELCLGGLGTSLLADWLVRDDVESGRLVRMLPDWEASVGVLGAVWVSYPSRIHLPTKARRFIEHVREAGRLRHKE